MKATLIKNLTGFRDDARLYQVTPPIKYTNYNDAGEEETHETSHVVVSGANVPITGPETYIFPSNEEGEIISWMELSGSFRGPINHAKALRCAGYETNE